MGEWLKKFREESFQDTKKRFLQYNEWLIYTGQICYSIIISCELLVFKRNVPKNDRWKVLRRFYLKDVPEELHFNTKSNLQFLAQKYSNLVYKIRPENPELLFDSEFDWRESSRPNDESIEEDLEVRELELIDPQLEQEILKSESTTPKNAFKTNSDGVI